MKITHLLFWVQDNTVSVKFYKKIGFEVVQSDDEHSIVALIGFQITLVTMRDESKFARDALSSDKGRGIYVYIRAEDVDALHAKFVKQGLTQLTEPQDWSWGNREFVLKDPDGYKLCFWQPARK